MAGDHPDDQGELSSFIGVDIVLDTRGELLYMGKLVRILHGFYELEDADVHDIVTGRTSKELYIMDARKHGIKKNRSRVLVRKVEVVSLSKLADVIEY
jgi:hypothetical protein